MSATRSGSGDAIGQGCDGKRHATRRALVGRSWKRSKLVGGTLSVPEAKSDLKADVAASATDETLTAGGKVMSLFEHLDELRKRLVRGFLAVALVFMGALAFSQDILNYLKQPLVQA